MKANQFPITEIEIPLHHQHRRLQTRNLQRLRKHLDFGGGAPGNEEIEKGKSFDLGSRIAGLIGETAQERESRTHHRKKRDLQ